MKPFNLEEAKAGKPVCTRDGRKARIICWDKKSEFPVVALIEEDKMESCINYTKEGYYYPDGTESKIDLFMASEPAYRPFKSAEEVLEAIKEHGDWVKSKMSGRYLKVVEVSECTIWAGCYATRETTQGYLYDEAFAGLVFADGTPFGKLEE